MLLEPPPKKKIQLRVNQAVVGKDVMTAAAV